MNDAATQIQMLDATRKQSVATLAAAIIVASGRPWSVQQAMALNTDIYFATYSEPNSGRYQEWAKTKTERLNKVHSAAG